MPSWWGVGLWCLILVVNLTALRDVQKIGEAHTGCVCEGVIGIDCHGSRQTEWGRPPPPDVGSTIQWVGGQMEQTVERRESCAHTLNPSRASVFSCCCHHPWTSDSSAAKGQLALATLQGLPDLQPQNRATSLVSLCSEVSNFSNWATACFPGTPVCRWLLWNYSVPDQVTHSNESPLIYLYIPPVLFLSRTLTNTDATFKLFWSYCMNDSHHFEASVKFASHMYYSQWNFS